MAGHGRPPGRGDALAPTDPRLLERPLEFIAEDHLRAREVCTMIDRIALADAPDALDIDKTVAFLRDELPLHLADEEEDLFPLMLRRCDPEDRIDRVIGRLRSDHNHAGVQTPDIVAVIGRLTSGQGPASAADRSMLTTYARHGRRHLIVENAIIMPLARARLTALDLETLRLRMTERRGLTPHSEAPRAE